MAELRCPCVTELSKPPPRLVSQTLFILGQSRRGPGRTTDARPSHRPNSQAPPPDRGGRVRNPPRPHRLPAGRQCHSAAAGVSQRQTIRVAPPWRVRASVFCTTLALTHFVWRSLTPAMDALPTAPRPDSSFLFASPSACGNLDQPGIVRFCWPESTVLRLVGNDSGAKPGV